MAQFQTQNGQTEFLNYFQDANGFLARAPRAGLYPGIVLIHEWWGLNDYIREEAKKLAAYGYNVLAVDLFGGQIAQTPEEARLLVQTVDPNIALENLRAAVRHLRQREMAMKVGTLGWCFGGGQAFRLSVSGEPLNVTVIYYGHVTADKTDLDKIHWPVLGIFGEEDDVVSAEAVRNFETALSELNIPHEIEIYPGVGHAFANPGNPKHAVGEKEDAWNKTVAFLERTLKN
ncbi:MAG: dienelactone hydrolase family protein [Candidatus Pacebacteria bacterium]|nr:dienelactone hydrolase family protein [Candidatus Paceibacterota bacterium]MDR3582866.1 dienelactone hydrolase family protein [Candidatus Paceibacterota bacterium]